MATDLGRVRIVPKGAYNANTTYEMLDLVTYNGSSYIALKSTKGNLPTNTTYWQLHGQGYPGNASGVAATDVQGLVVTAGGTSTIQALINALADKVKNALLKKTDLLTQIVNDTTRPISASAVYSVKQEVDGLNSDLLQMANDNYRLVAKFGNSNITSNADGSFQLTHGLGAPCVVIARFGGTNQGYITFGGDIGENSAYGVVRDTNGKGFAFTGGIFWVAIGFVHR